MNDKQILTYFRKLFIPSQEYIKVIKLEKT
jgi:hypothetical protein